MNFNSPPRPTSIPSLASNVALPGRTEEPGSWAAKRRAQLENAAQLRAEREREEFINHTFQPRFYTKEAKGKGDTSLLRQEVVAQDVRRISGAARLAFEKRASDSVLLEDGTVKEAVEDRSSSSYAEVSSAQAEQVKVQVQWGQKEQQEFENRLARYQSYQTRSNIVRGSVVGKGNANIKVGGSRKNTETKLTSEQCAIAAAAEAAEELAPEETRSVSDSSSCARESVESDKGRVSQPLSQPLSQLQVSRRSSGSRRGSAKPKEEAQSLTQVAPVDVASEQLVDNAASDTGMLETSLVDAPEVSTDECTRQVSDRTAVGSVSDAQELDEIAHMASEQPVTDAASDANMGEALGEVARDAQMMSSSESSHQGQMHASETHINSGASSSPVNSGVIGADLAEIKCGGAAEELPQDAHMRGHAVAQVEASSQLSEQQEQEQSKKRHIIAPQSILIQKEQQNTEQSKEYEDKSEGSPPVSPSFLGRLMHIWQPYTEASDADATDNTVSGAKYVAEEPPMKNLILQDPPVKNGSSSTATSLAHAVAKAEAAASLREQQDEGDVKEIKPSSNRTSDADLEERERAGSGITEGQRDRVGSGAVEGQRERGGSGVEGLSKDVDTRSDSSSCATVTSGTVTSTRAPVAQQEQSKPTYQLPALRTAGVRGAFLGKRNSKGLDSTGVPISYASEQSATDEAPNEDVTATVASDNLEETAKAEEVAKDAQMSSFGDSSAPVPEVRAKTAETAIDDPVPVDQARTVAPPAQEQEEEQEQAHEQREHPSKRLGQPQPSPSLMGRLMKIWQPFINGASDEVVEDAASRYSKSTKPSVPTDAESALARVEVVVQGGSPIRSGVSPRRKGSISRQPFEPIKVSEQPASEQPSFESSLVSHVDKLMGDFEEDPLMRSSRSTTTYAPTEPDGMSGAGEVRKLLFVPRTAARATTPGPDETEQQKAREAAAAGVAEAVAELAKLRDLWKIQRHSIDPITDEEKQILEKIVFATMPKDVVHIMSVDRVEQGDLLRIFCKEEQDSIDREREQNKKHKEFMLLHGTRWENVSSVRSVGLDPDLGHLGKGVWLGQNAEAVHTYAAKGPGPEQDDGRRLFAMFAVASVPSHYEGDEERSFGVWRIMSGSRMYPAYLVVYAAPIDIRVKKPYPAPRMNRSVQMLMQLRSSDCGSATPPPHLRPLDPRGSQRSPRSWQSEQNPGKTSPLRGKSPEQPPPQHRRALYPDLMRDMRFQRSGSPRSPVSDALYRGKSVEVQPGQPQTTPLMQQPKLASHRASSQDDLRNRSFDADLQSPKYNYKQGSSFSLLYAAKHSSGGDLSTRDRDSLGGGFGGSFGGSFGGDNLSASCRDIYTPRRSSGTYDVLSSSFRERPVPELQSPRRAIASSSKTQLVKPVIKWELHLDDGWIPFAPGVRYNDTAGVQQDLFYRNSWYRLVFDSTGMTGTQTNLSTRKSRQLRRIQGTSVSLPPGQALPAAASSSPVAVNAAGPSVSVIAGSSVTMTAGSSVTVAAGSSPSAGSSVSVGAATPVAAQAIQPVAVPAGPTSS